MKMSNKYISSVVPDEKLKEVLERVEKQVAALNNKYAINKKLPDNENELLLRLKAERTIIKDYFDINENHQFAFYNNEWLYLLARTSYVEKEGETFNRGFANVVENAMYAGKYMRHLVSLILNRTVEPDVYILGVKDDGSLDVDACLNSFMPDSIYEMLEDFAERRSGMYQQSEEYDFFSYNERNAKYITTNMTEKQINDGLFKENNVLCKEENSMLRKWFELEKRIMKRVTKLEKYIDGIPDIELVNESHANFIRALAKIYYAIPTEEVDLMKLDSRDRLEFSLKRLQNLGCIDKDEFSDITREREDYIFFNKNEIRYILKNCIFYDDGFEEKMGNYAEKLLSAMKDDISDDIISYLVNFYTKLQIDLTFNKEFLDPEIPLEEDWAPVTPTICMSVRFPTEMYAVVEALNKRSVKKEKETKKEMLN